MVSSPNVLNPAIFGYSQICTSEGGTNNLAPEQHLQRISIMITPPRESPGWLLAYPQPHPTPTLVLQKII